MQCSDSSSLGFHHLISVLGLCFIIIDIIVQLYPECLKLSTQAQLGLVV